MNKTAHKFINHTSFHKQNYFLCTFYETRKTTLLKLCNHYIQLIENIIKSEQEKIK